MKARYDLSVSLHGWTNMPALSDADHAAIRSRYALEGVGGNSRSGECALLEVANNDTRELRFDSLGVEFKTKRGWERVVPRNWPWFAGCAWIPGFSSTLAVPRPAEVPTGVAWKVEFLCRPDAEADVGRPARMWTPEIPPMDHTNANA